MGFVSDLTQRFEVLAHTENATAMAAYMKDRFQFLGIKAPQRKAGLKEVIQLHKAKLDRKSILAITKTLYKLPYREYHYCAVELVTRFVKGKFEREDIGCIEFLIVTHSWWDSVDMICKHHLGSYLLQFPDQVAPIIQRYSDADHLWLNRSAILFQLEYKSQTNADLLFALCAIHKNSTAFFIKKAIGWALRTYSKTDPEAVQQFVAKHTLSPLSKKEALRLV